MNRRIIGVDPDITNTNRFNNSFDLFINMKGSKRVCRTLRYDKEANILFINYDDTTIFFAELSENNDFRVSKIEYDKYDSERLADFRIARNKRLIVLDQDGLMSVFSYAPKLSSNPLVFSYRINSEYFDNERYEYFTAMTICKETPYIAVSSYTTEKRIAKHLFILAINDRTGAIKRLEKIGLRKELQFHDEYYAMTFFNVEEGFPILLATHKSGTGSLLSFFFNGMRLEEFFGEFAEMVDQENYKIEVYGKYFFTLDYRGKLLRFAMEGLQGNTDLK